MKALEDYSVIPRRIMLVGGLPLLLMIIIANAIFTALKTAGGAFAYDFKILAFIYRSLWAKNVWYKPIEIKMPEHDSIWR
jgi:hypothetical protein